MAQHQKYLKGKLYQGGVLNPAVFYWPTHIQPDTSQAFVHLIDILPTITTNVGIEEVETDGVNILFQSPNDSMTINNRAIFQRVPRKDGSKSLSIIKDGWKLILNLNREELFDLKTDPWEKRNLAETELNIAQTLKTELLNWDNGYNHNVISDILFNNDCFLDLTKLEVILFPNPSPNQFQLFITSPEVEKVGVSLFDVRGRLIEERELSGEREYLESFELSTPGLYHVSVKTGTQSKVRKVLIGN